MEEEYDILVLEGAGSPAEINLKEQDIVNLGMAKLSRSPVVLVALSKEEASEYLKAGINNTIKYETSQEALKDLSTFLKRRKDQKIKKY